MATTGTVDKATLADLQKAMIGRAVIKDTDMNPEMQGEVQDVIVSGIENNSAQRLNVEAAAKYIKENLDRKFGPSWHCILGEGYACDLHMQEKTMMYMFYNGKIAVIVFKA